MARKTYKLTVDGRIYELRLTLDGQRQLKERHPDMEIKDIIGSAIDNNAIMADLLDVSLKWADNPNPNNMTGEKLFDTMVDEDICGELEQAKVALGIAGASGIFDARTRASLLKKIEAYAQGLAADGDEEPEGAATPTESRSTP